MSIIPLFICIYSEKLVNASGDVYSECVGKEPEPNSVVYGKCQSAHGQPKVAVVAKSLLKETISSKINWYSKKHDECIVPLESKVHEKCRNIVKNKLQPTQSSKIPWYSKRYEECYDDEKESQIHDKCRFVVQSSLLPTPLPRIHKSAELREFCERQVPIGNKKSEIHKTCRKEKPESFIYDRCGAVKSQFYSEPYDRCHIAQNQALFQQSPTPQRSVSAPAKIETAQPMKEKCKGWMCRIKKMASAVHRIAKNSGIIKKAYHKFKAAIKYTKAVYDKVTGKVKKNKETTEVLSDD